MAGFKLDVRARLSIELALTAGRGDPNFVQQQEKDAKALGMTGAEIDMARKGSSFYNARRNFRRATSWPSIHGLESRSR